MAIEAEGDAVVSRVLPAFSLLLDVVQLDLDSTESMTDAAVPRASDQNLFFDVSRETHGAQLVLCGSSRQREHIKKTLDKKGLFRCIIW
jgi:hypothetical protein